MRIKMTVAYDGLKFSGWQKQNNALSVEETLENALTELFGKTTKVYASGRTDEGVSATGQTVHFDCNTTIPPEKIVYAVNNILPDSVKALNSEKTKDDFNARYDVKRKTYRYRTYISEIEIPFETHRLQLKTLPNVTAMEDAAKLLVGVHNFKAFSSTGSSVKTTEREIYALDIQKTRDGLDFVVTGNGFLYNMVRIIVGTLLDVGYNKYGGERITEALNSGKRNLVGKTVRPQGLILEKVEY